MLFQYAAEGTAVNNQNWMTRKYNSVRLMERSSLASRVAEGLGGNSVEACGLDPRQYVFCGGGFPIRLKTGEMVAVALASGLPDVMEPRLSRRLPEQIPRRASARHPPGRKLNGAKMPDVRMFLASGVFSIPGISFAARTCPSRTPPRSAVLDPHGQRVRRFGGAMPQASMPASRASHRARCKW